MSVFRKRSKSDTQVEFTCSIRFLDDLETIQLSFKKDTLGVWLLDTVCEKLNLVEKDYFGLRYVDADNQRHWLDPLKTVHKQLKGLSKMVLCFRVKFYPEDPMKLMEEITRYYLFLQLRRDLHHGRLLCSHEEAIQLAAHIIQSEVGDYDPEDHLPGYITDFKMLPKQTVKHEERILEAHKALTGEVPSEAEMAFLKKASSLDTYGVDPHQVKDQKGDLLYLGVTYQGIMTFRGNRRTQLFNWAQTRRLAYEGKMFMVYHSNVEEDKPSKKKPVAVGFKCTTSSAAKYLWRSAVEQQLFFTLKNSDTTHKVRSGGTLFTRGSKFRFSGRTQNEAYEASENIHRMQPNFKRTSSLPNFAKRSHPDSKNSTMRDSVMSDSFREEAAVDVPHILVNNSPVLVVSSPSDSQDLVEGPKVIAAPLAPQEDAAIAVEEVIVQATPVSEVNAALPPTSVPAPSKENGQAVREQQPSGILETSIDETLPYEPNRTMEETDSEEGTGDGEGKPGLDEQIALLDEEIKSPNFAAEMNLGPAPATPLAKSAAPAASKKGGSVAKVMAYSVLLALAVFLALFYVVFFSSVNHPLVPKLRDGLKFLQPVADAVGQKAALLMKKT